MRQLDRSQHPAPHCLAKYKSNQKWKELAVENKGDYATIVDALAAVQGERCAYCECDLARERRRRPHVDHFMQRRRLPNLTFEWSNLFWSCSHNDCCGKHKDKPETHYKDEDLIKPDVDDPRRFLYFYADGWAGPRPGLTGREEHRAKVTIEVFNLNSDGLRARRLNYQQIAVQEQQQAFGTLDVDEAIAYFDLLRTDYASLPFYSAILDTLE